MQQTYMPLVESLRNYIEEETIPFHMPGHKMGRGFPPEIIDNIVGMDVTEIPGTDNLHKAEGAIKEAQLLAAQAFGAKDTLFLVNGSTCGIHAMIMSTCHAKDKLIVPRNCHKSVWGAMILADVKPVYIMPEYDSFAQIPTQVSVDTVRECLDRHPDVRGMVLVHPNYYGMASHIKEIAHILKSRGKILLVDEAHGAHFPFHPKLPQSSKDAGAYMWVQSAHKTLPAFTQSAYLHINGDEHSKYKVKNILSLIESTSPSYMLMASLDYARYFMVKEGRTRLDNLLCSLEDLKAEFEREYGPNFFSDAKWDEVACLDGTRLVLDVRPFNMTGYEAEYYLRHMGIQAEMADMNHVVFICTVSDDMDMLNRLFNSLRSLADKGAVYKTVQIHTPIFSKIPKQIMSPKDAFYSIIDKVTLEDASGKICAGMVGAYPPGIPRFCPGELIDNEGIEELLELESLGAILFGTEGEAHLIPVVEE